MKRKCKFNLGDTVVVLGSANYARDLIGKSFLVTLNERYEKPWDTFEDADHFFYNKTYDEIWVCLGDRNVKENDLRLYTKLDLALK